MIFPQNEAETSNFKPENELGVIVLFSQQAASAGYEIITVQPDFPDLLIRKTGVEYEAEAEYYASNFKVHGHPPHKCDVIVCWENDYPDSILPILALSDPSWKTQKIIVPSKEKREIIYWRSKAQELQKRLDALKSGHINSKASPDDVTRMLRKIGNASDTLRILAKSPLMSQTEIAEYVGVCRRGVGYHIQRLIEEGLIAENSIYGYEILVDLPSEFLMQEEKGEFDAD